MTVCPVCHGEIMREVENTDDPMFSNFSSDYEEGPIGQGFEIIYGAEERYCTGWIPGRHSELGRVYSYWSLITKKGGLLSLPKSLIPWSRRWDSNPRPADYESAALPLSYAGPIGVWPYSTRIYSRSREIENRADPGVRHRECCQRKGINSCTSAEVAKSARDSR